MEKLFIKLKNNISKLLIFSSRLQSHNPGVDGSSPGCIGNRIRRKTITKSFV